MVQSRYMKLLISFSMLNDINSAYRDRAKSRNIRDIREILIFLWTSCITEFS